MSEGKNKGFPIDFSRFRFGRDVVNREGTAAAIFASKPGDCNAASNYAVTFFQSGKYTPEQLEQLIYDVAVLHSKHVPGGLHAQGCSLTDAMYGQKIRS